MEEKEPTSRQREWTENGWSREEDINTLPIKREAQPTQGRKPKRPRALTKRELEVAKLISEGLFNPEIGKQLTIELNTVEAHIRNIQNKWDAKNKHHISSLYVVEALKALCESSDEK